MRPLGARGGSFAPKDAANERIRPLMGDRSRCRERHVLGYAGVYSRLLRRAAGPAMYGVDVRSILLEVGRRGLVGGREDTTEDIALDLGRAG